MDTGSVRLRDLLLALLVLSPGLSRAAGAEDGLQLRVDGKPVALRAGLQRSADGKVWITTDDLVEALGIVVRRLIPRPPEGTRARPRNTGDPWVLCGPDTCNPYDGELRDASTEPAFDLARVARLLGHRLRVRGQVHDLTTDRPRKTRSAHARVGRIVPPLTLSFRDGTTQTLGAVAPKRLLLVTWATWSPARDQLEAWRTYFETRIDRDLVLWFVALDIEGEARVKDYAAPAGDTPIALDRQADLARILPLQDVGRWFFIDELGVLRAEGARLDETSRLWIDLHLEEAPQERTPTTAKPRRTDPLAVLRERVAAEPNSVPARLALLDALGDTERAEAIRHAEALVEIKPKFAPFAFRLGSLQLDADDPASALDVLEAARRRAPATWYLRRQYWALLEPLRYYAGPIDTAWERAQRKEEELAFGRRRR